MAEEPAAAPTQAPAEEPTAAKKVAVLFPGVVSDQSWNQFGFEGLKQAEADCGVEIAYSENVMQDAQLETFRNYAAEGYDIIIGHGGEYSDSAVSVAAQYPDVEFGCTNCGGHRVQICPRSRLATARWATWQEHLPAR